MNIRVIHCKRDPHDPTENYIYIGRPSSDSRLHWGNPFSHKKGSKKAAIWVTTRHDAIRAFEKWLDGETYQHVEPARRLWILDRMQDLAAAGEDLVLGCWCVPQACHGQVIAARILTYRAAFEARPGEEVIIIESEE